MISVLVPAIRGLAALLMTVGAAHAFTLVIAPGPRLLLVQIGSAGAVIDKVTFSPAATNVGTGTPIVGAPAILVRVLARDTVPRVVQLVADSSVPLNNGASNVPFTTVSWTTSDADIAPGTFTGAAGQLILLFPNNRLISNTHTFRYANTQILQPGTYTGRVTYTVSMP